MKSKPSTLNQQLSTVASAYAAFPAESEPQMAAARLAISWGSASISSLTRDGRIIHKLNGPRRNQRQKQK